MQRSGITELEVVLAVARHRSFRAAARELGMSTSAVSSAVAGLEARLQARLFNRSTRSVALTDAGLRFVERITPALAEIQRASEEVSAEPDAPSGTLRINAPPETALMLLEPLLVEYMRRYPQVNIDIVTEPRMVDIVADGFDAGIRLAESVPQDMIAVPLTADIRMLIVASPDYLARHGTPQQPDELLRHQGIGMRMSHGGIYHWELERDGRKLQVDMPVRITLNESRAIRQAALNGVGLAFIAEWFIRDDVAKGELIPLLTAWSQPFGGLRLYYSGRRYLPARLRALIDLIHEHRDNGIVIG
ncbi:MULTISPECIES: LysR family transcriptional regulator [unclassified Serratia (in: enterobacteria)]|uniref:LysR family transcriptional regulator n=1 Tax=unclassified Serratia (in: enterobacteria) TaxID=2647522 RepID=UPI000468727D|nr:MULTISPECIES: LysR family transcriptional regulator [unclassified Serratia (in: enterobacteria)]